MKKNVLFGVAVLLLCVISAKAQTFVLQVDMSYVVTGQVSGTTFDPAVDTIDVAGSFNGWGATATDLTRVSDTAYIYEVALDLDSAMHLINYKFRVNHSWDGDKHDQLPADRRFTVRENTEYADTVKSFWSDMAPGKERMSFKVNMSKQIADGNFDPETEFLDVAGTFNNWGGYNELTPGNDGMYSGYVLAPIGDIEWKTRTNGSWDKHESLDANRMFTVAEGSDNMVSYWYANDSLTTSVTGDLFAQVNAYPNPFNNVVTLTNLNGVEKITISNVIGQQFKSIEVLNQESVQINTADYNAGVYFIILENVAGDRKAMRVVKQ